MHLPLLSNSVYGSGIEAVSALKDISPPPTKEPEPIILPGSPTSKRPPISFFNPRTVTSTYIGRSVKQVSYTYLIIITPWNQKKNKNIQDSHERLSNIFKISTCAKNIYISSLSDTSRSVQSQWQNDGSCLFLIVMNAKKKKIVPSVKLFYIQCERFFENIF